MIASIGAMHFFLLAPVGLPNPAGNGLDLAIQAERNSTMMFIELRAAKETSIGESRLD
jgi:hypothetical protein